MPCLCVPLRRAPHRYNYQPSAWTWNCHCPIGRKGGDSPSHPTPITCKVVIEIPGWFPEHGVDWSHGWGSRIAMESVFLLSHSPLPASAPPPHLSQAPRTSSSPSSQLRKDWETALTFVLRFTSNQFFSNPKEGLSPKSQMFPTIVTGRLRTGWESPHFLLTRVFTLLLSQCWAWLESVLLCTIPVHNQPRVCRPAASLPNIKESGSVCTEDREFLDQADLGPPFLLLLNDFRQLA